MPKWKIFLIQFLNIAGLGPIFGAIMGAKFGSASFLWIVFGCIFAGAMHDYFAGMMSLRHNGEGLPSTVGRYLGNTAQTGMRIFTLILLIIVGVVFVSGPANLLAMLTPESFDATFWILAIFAYYIVATLFPIDKIIGKIYPVFGFALLFMAIGILGVLLFTFPDIPEITDGVKNMHPKAESNPIFPMMFVRYGAQCVVLSADVKKVDGVWRIFAKGGRENTGMDAIEWIHRCAENGAGEIVVNSIDTDGVKNGFDLPLLQAVCDVVNVPVIASGGAGSIDHFLTLFNTLPGVDAGLAASIFHFGEVSIRDLKRQMAAAGIPTRL